MEWKAIKGYEGYYEVSDAGLVRGLDRVVPDKVTGTKLIHGKILQAVENRNKTRNGDGYLVVNLHKYGSSNVIPIHRLVAEAFLENPENRPTVNHKDGNKHNNSLTNLEWSSYADNNAHALNKKLRQPRGNKIIQFEINGTFVAEYKSACEASRITGIGRSMISHCLNNRAKTAGGYKWSKVKECNDYPTRRTTDDELPLEAQERVQPEDIVYPDGNV